MIKSAEEFVAFRRSAHKEEYLRAVSESAEIDVWREVISQYPDMKVWVAHNKTVPEEILRILSSDPDVDVRQMVAMKNKLPDDLRALLANDEEEPVRERIVFNKNTSKELLEQLANDPVERISLAARARLTR